MKKPLLLDGKRFDPNPPKATFLKIAEFLDKHQGEVFTIMRVRESTGVGDANVRRFSLDERYSAYTNRTGKAYILGTPSAIQEYRKMTELAGKCEG